MRAIALALCLLATTARASFVFMSGLETLDNGTVGTTADSVEFPAANVIEASGDSTVGLCSITASPVCIPHNAANGGGSGSVYALRANTTSGQIAYYQLPSGILSSNTATAGFNIHQNAAPGIAYVAAALMEGSNMGCLVRVNTDRTMSVFYRDTSGASSVSFGTTVVKLQRDYCSGVSCTTDNDCSPDNGICLSGTCANISIPCTAATQATDCPSGQTCATCSTVTGAGCYMPTLELVQINRGSTVDCELWVNGVRQLAGLASNVTTAAIDSARWGVIDGPAGSNTVSFDDLVITDDDRTGWGFISTAVPTTDGPTTQWSSNSCTTSAYESCIDDWESGGPYDTNATGTGGTIRAMASGRINDWSRVSSLSTNDVTIDDVQTVLTGQTSGSASTGTISGNILACASASTCAGVSGTSTASTVFNDSTHRVLLRFNATVSPPADSWNATTLALMGGRVTASSVPSGGTIRVGGVVHYVHATRADAPATVTLQDHNIGTNDGEITLCLVGDSTNGGTLSVTCQGGTQAGAACGQDSYCSDFGATKDTPVGGCDGGDGSVSSTDHYVCQTCQGNAAHPRSAYGGGAGYPCGPNNGSATCNLGTCTAAGCDGGLANCCTGDTTVSCSTNADCDLGNCDTCSNADCSAQTPGSTCIDACPGGNGITTGICPTDRVGWGDYVTTAADNVVKCGTPSETWLEFARGTQASALLTGNNPFLFCGVLSGTGRCSCAVNADCDSGAGGTCTNGNCSGGNASTCDANGDCESAICHNKPCDYLVNFEGFNDNFVVTDEAMNTDCTNAVSAGCTNRCPRIACTADSTCSSRSADSQCIVSTYKNFGTLYCNTFNSFGGRCLEEVQPCNSSSDCPLSQTCSNGTPGAVTPTGYCNCGADAQTPSTCQSGYACTSGKCTFKCTTAADCGTNGTCSSQGAYSVCSRVCSCPCNSTDMTGFPNSGACTKDTDCYNATVSTQTYQKIEFRGKCVSGKCRCCGPQACTDGGVCDAAVSRTRRAYTHLAPHALRDLDDLRSALMQQAGDTDGGPILIPTTIPKPNSTECALYPIGRPDHKYSGDVSNHFLRERRHVIDFRSAIAPYMNSGAFADEVHPTPFGGSILGAAATQYLNSLNVCALYGGTAQSRAVSYCKGNDGTWPGTLVCCSNCPTKAGVCTATQSCKVKPCTATSECSGTGVTCNTE